MRRRSSRDALRSLSATVALEDVGEPPGLSIPGGDQSEGGAASEDQFVGAGDQGPPGQDGCSARGVEQTGRDGVRRRGVDEPADGRTDAVAADQQVAGDCLTVVEHDRDIVAGLVRVGDAAAVPQLDAAVGDLAAQGVGEVGTPERAADRPVGERPAGSCRPEVLARAAAHVQPWRGESGVHGALVSTEKAQRVDAVRREREEHAAPDAVFTCFEDDGTEADA